MTVALQVHLHVDFLQHPRCHNLVVRCGTGRITWDGADDIVHWYDAASQQHEALPPPPGNDRNTMFLDEARHFLDCVDGRTEPLTSLADGRRSLAVLMAIRQATAEHREVAVS